MYQPGELDQLITIKKEITIDDGYGGEEIAQEQKVFDVWAKVKPLSGGESKDQDRVHDTSMYRFIVRYTNEINEEHIIYWNNYRFEVKSILDRGPRSLYLEFNAERNSN